MELRHYQNKRIILGLKGIQRVKKIVLFFCYSVSLPWQEPILGVGSGHFVNLYQGRVAVAVCVAHRRVRRGSGNVRCVSEVGTRSGCL